MGKKESGGVLVLTQCFVCSVLEKNAKHSKENFYKAVRLSLAQGPSIEIILVVQLTKCFEPKLFIAKTNGKLGTAIASRLPIISFNISAKLYCPWIHSLSTSMI